MPGSSWPLLMSSGQGRARGGLFGRWHPASPSELGVLASIVHWAIRRGATVSVYLGMVDQPG